MAFAAQRIRELILQIKALRAEDQIELLRRILTPEMELRLLANEFSQRTQGHDPQEVAREVDEAVREVRQQRKNTLATAS